VARLQVLLGWENVYRKTTWFLASLLLQGWEEWCAQVVRRLCEQNLEVMTVQNPHQHHWEGAVSCYFCLILLMLVATGGRAFWGAKCLFV
jgi:hypothetical protein